MDKLSNIEIYYWLTEWCKEVGLDPGKVPFKVDHKKKIIYIFADRPGFLIGKAGVYTDKYKKKLEELLVKYKIKAKYTYELVEVTMADFWVNYEWFGE